MNLPTCQRREAESIFTGLFLVVVVLLFVSFSGLLPRLELEMKLLEGTLRVKSSTSSWQNCSLLLFVNVSCHSNIFV